MSPTGPDRPLIPIARNPPRMWDVDLQRFSRQCTASGRSLVPGETYFSALVRRGAEVERQDFAVEAWSGPPADTIAWWRATVPDPKSRKPNWAPNDVILHYFAQLDEEPGEADARYVLALFMLRRRLLKLVSESQTDGQTVLELDCPKLEMQFTVPVIHVDAARIAQIQQQLMQLLDGSEAP